MNCAQCNYVLFGLSEPRCPECGQEFDVTDFAFPIGAVHFLCPYCKQAYGGNDEFGLPKPRTFQCVKCHRHIAASSMIVRPARQEVMGEALRFGNIWEHRAQLGGVRAFFQSVSQIALQPADFFRIGYGNSRNDALFFGVLCGYGGAAAMMAVMLAFGELFPMGKMPTPDQLFHFSTLFFVALIVPIFTWLWAFMYAILIHLTLVCTAGPTVDFEHSVQVVGYSAAVLPAMVLPPVGLVWYVSCVAVGLRYMHGLSKGRAIVAALMPVLFCMNLIVLWVVYNL